MRRASQSALARYVVAVAATLAALALALLVYPPVGQLSPFFVFYAAVAVSSWFGGLLPGVTATLLGAIATSFFLLEPRYSFQVANLGDAARLLLFGMVGILISGLNGALRTSQRRCEVEAAAARKAESRATRLAEANLIGVFFSDLGGTIQACNSEFMKLVGCSREELAAGLVNWNYVTAPEHRERDDRAIEELRNCRVCTPYEKDHILKDGHRVPVLMGCALLDESVNDVVGFVLNLSERRRAEAEIRAHKERLQAVGAELLLAEERERRRISVVLHDAVSQNLALAQLKLSAVRRMAEADAVVPRLVEINELVEEAVRQTRSLTSELSPPVLYELGLGPAIQWLGDRFREQHGISFQMKDDKQPRPLTHETKVILFQAVRELLVNVVKHARASACTVDIGSDGKQIQIVVKDNGRGFQHSARPSGRGDGYGLFNVRERLAHLGGSADIAAGDGAGATVTLAAPLANTHKGEADERQDSTRGRPPDDASGSPEHAGRAARL